MANVIPMANNNLDMDETEDDERFVKLLQKYKSLESRISHLEDQMRLAGLDSRPKNKLVNDLIDNVSAVVGLKEMVTARHRCIRFAWAALLALGIMATVYYVVTTATEYLHNPTATNIELQRQSKYHYPHLLLCPGSSVDTEKALSKGLTKEALIYSLAYMDRFIVEPINVTRGRKEFEKFYIHGKYGSLLEYYQDIAADVNLEPTVSLLANRSTSGAHCSGCNESAPVEKVIVGESMCYSFRIKSVDGTSFHMWGTAPQIIMQMQDKSAGAGSITTNWNAYLTSDTHILQPNFPAIALESSAASILKTSAQKFVTLNKNSRAGCLNKADMPEGYSAEKCTVACFNKSFKKRHNCSLFSYSAYDEPESTSNYCNYFEKLPGTDVMFSEYMNNNGTDLTLSKHGTECTQKCLFPCVRTLFTSLLDSRYPIELDSSKFTSNARRHNLSFVIVSIDNTAISQGGILTLTEVSTFSFATLVSNVGGTLGLFVGGTILTFFQIILWLAQRMIDYIIHRRVAAQGIPSV